MTKLHYKVKIINAYVVHNPFARIRVKHRKLTWHKKSLWKRLDWHTTTVISVSAFSRSFVETWQFQLYVKEIASVEICLEVIYCLHGSMSTYVLNIQAHDVSEWSQHAVRSVFILESTVVFTIARKFDLTFNQNKSAWYTISYYSSTELEIPQN